MNDKEIPESRDIVADVLETAEDIRGLLGYILDCDKEKDDFFEQIRTRDLEPENGKKLHELCHCPDDEEEIGSVLTAFQNMNPKCFALEFGGGHVYAIAVRIEKRLFTEPVVEEGGDPDDASVGIPMMHRPSS